MKINDILLVELEIRSFHKKKDLLLEDEIKFLTEFQAKQFELLNHLHNKIDALAK